MNDEKKYIYFVDIKATEGCTKDEINTYAFLLAENQAEAEKIANDVTGLWNEQDRDKGWKYERRDILPLGWLEKTSFPKFTTIWTNEEVIKELDNVDIWGGYTLGCLLMILKNEFPKTEWTVRTLVKAWDIIRLDDNNFVTIMGWEAVPDVIANTVYDEIVELIGTKDNKVALAENE